MKSVSELLFLVKKGGEMMEKMRVSGDLGIRLWVSGYQGPQELTIGDCRYLRHKLSIFDG